MKTIFAQNLRKYRKICGMTQKTLAKELHYSHTAIANYESGRNEPSLSDLCRLSDILGVGNGGGVLSTGGHLPPIRL